MCSGSGPWRPQLALQSEIFSSILEMVSDFSANFVSRHMILKCIRCKSIDLFEEVIKVNMIHLLLSLLNN